MSLSDDVDLEVFVMSKDDLSGNQPTICKPPEHFSKIYSSHSISFFLDSPISFFAIFYLILTPFYQIAF